MVKEAEKYAEEDRRKREEVETRNSAENTAFAAEKLLLDNADKVPDDLKTEIEGQITEVRTALTGEDIGQIRAALETLQASVQKVGEAVYSQAGTPPGPDGEAPQADGEQEPPEGTVEGEFREV